MGKDEEIGVSLKRVWAVECPSCHKKVLLDILKRMDRRCVYCNQKLKLV